MKPAAPAGAVDYYVDQEEDDMGHLGLGVETVRGLAADMLEEKLAEDNDD